MENSLYVMSGFLSVKIYWQALHVGKNHSILQVLSFEFVESDTSSIDMGHMLQKSMDVTNYVYVVRRIFWLQPWVAP